MRKLSLDIRISITHFPTIIIVLECSVPVFRVVISSQSDWMQPSTSVLEGQHDTPRFVRLVVTLHVTTIKNV